MFFQPPILFKGRREAGEKLAERLKRYQGQPAVVLAVPRGGVLVAAPIAKILKAKLDVMVLRKLPIPYNPEMGFGAITSDGTILLNEPVVRDFMISKDEIQQISKIVLKEVRRREKVYRGEKPFPEVKDKIVILIDDGLATGFTMLAAIKSIKKYQPKKVVVAVPVSPQDSIKRVKPQVDELICLYIQKAGFSFAVASFYQEFPDPTDEKVIELLREF